MKSISSNENLISKDKYFLLYSKPHNIYYKSSNSNVHKIGSNIYPEEMIIILNTPRQNK